MRAEKVFEQALKTKGIGLKQVISTLKFMKVSDRKIYKLRCKYGWLRYDKPNNNQTVQKLRNKYDIHPSMED